MTSGSERVSLSASLSVRQASLPVEKQLKCGHKLNFLSVRKRLPVIPSSLVSLPPSLSVLSSSSPIQYVPGLLLCLLFALIKSTKKPGLGSYQCPH